MRVRKEKNGNFKQGVSIIFCSGTCITPISANGLDLISNVSWQVPHFTFT